ncbi:hypothetical protein [Ectothiorhodospira shaposhnikovii]|uniref:hypothetical protein n=1 Tax=Ectothiorhodospira shaposhnikovii TaxID=1054 RepID=UPI001EE80E5F|nr:hypothetical protein [Ectothiorhodospira shaposhnikovii]MCG5512820.1 hypothetical protein [Ectothiorhodospira shaposhnikovii]
MKKTPETNAEFAANLFEERRSGKNCFFRILGGNWHRIPDLDDAEQMERFLAALKRSGPLRVKVENGPEVKMWRWVWEEGWKAYN